MKVSSFQSCPDYRGVPIMGCPHFRGIDLDLNGVEISGSTRGVLYGPTVNTHSNALLK